MSKLLVFIIFIAVFIFEVRAEFIGGGKTDNDKLFVIHFEMPKGLADIASCTATHLSPDWIITAAHCVTDVEKRPKEPLVVMHKVIKPGDVFRTGTVKQVRVNPEYEKNKIALERLKLKENPTKYELAKAQEFEYLLTANDTALIELEGKTWGGVDFPKLATPAASLGEVTEVTLSGYGSHQTTWDKDAQAFVTIEDGISSLQSATVGLTCASNPAYLNEFAGIDKIIENHGTQPFFYSTSKITHYIENQKETLKFSQGTLYDSDSGGGGFVTEADGSLVLVSINSGNMDLGSENARLIIHHNGKKSIYKMSDDEIAFLNDWGDVKTSPTSNMEVQKYLKQNAMMNMKGELASGVKLTKAYDQNQGIALSNILFPSNQVFLKQHLTENFFQTVKN